MNDVNGQHSDEIRFLARGPLEQAKRFSAYNVNGFKFRTLARDHGLKTQNSGVFEMPRTKRFKAAPSLSENSNATIDGTRSMPFTHSGGAHSMPFTHSGGAHSMPFTHSGRAHSMPVEATHSSETTHSSEAAYIDPDGPASDRPVNSSRKNNSYWHVGVIDEQGIIKETRLKVQDVWSLPNGKKVVISCNEEGQPIDDGGGLLGGFLGDIGSDFSSFPISYHTWHDVPSAYKERVYNEIIERKIHLEDNRFKGYIMKNIGKKWKDNRCKLYHEYYDPTLSREANIQKHPSGIDRDQWALFIDYRLEEKTKERCKKNAENRKKQTIPHTGGSKSLSRRKAEEERQRGSRIGRGEMWNVTHKRKDGSYVNDEAKAIGEKITEIEQKNTSSQLLSQEDSLAQVFGKEHPGRVRGLGFGPFPSQIFGQTTHQFGGISSFASAGCARDSQMETTLHEIKSELQSVKSELENERGRRRAIESLVTFLFQQFQGNLPAEIAAMVNPVASDEGSVPISPRSRPSSSASHDARNQQNPHPRK